MATFLLILKIIGLVLLGILALALLLILMVLFVPVRYNIRGHYRDNVYLKARVTYLLYLFGVTVTYTDVLKVILRIILIPIRLLPKRAKKAKADKPGKPDKKAEASGDKKEAAAESSSPGDTEAPVANTEDEPDTGKKRKGHISDKDEEGSESAPKLGTLDKIRAYADLLNDPVTLEAWDVCKYRLGKLLKALIPKDIDIRVRYGMDDPYMTSVIMSVYNVFYVYIGGGLSIEPVYNGKLIEAEGRIRGRIMVFPVLWQALMVILNKDCRRFFKRFKKIR